MMGDAEYAADLSIAPEVLAALENPSALMDAAAFASPLFARFATLDAATKKLCHTALEVPLFQETRVHPPPSVVMSQ